MKNRRRFNRVDVWLKAQIVILIPEEALGLPPYECTVCDLSERGALVLTTVPDQVVPQLLRGIRHCRLRLKDNPGLPERITGRAVWIQPETSGSSINIKLGLFFEDCSEDTVIQLRTYLISASTFPEDDLTGSAQL